MKDESVDIQSTSHEQLIEKYGDGFSFKAVSNRGRRPYMCTGGQYNTMSSSAEAFYIIPKGQYYIIKNKRNQYAYITGSSDGTHYVLQTSSESRAEPQDFKANGYSVAFNVNGGSASLKSQTVSSLSLPSPGSKTGYTFAGWYDGNTHAGAAGSKYTPTKNVTLTAKWTANKNTKYIVKHHQMNVSGSGYTLAATESLTGTTGASITPATKSYTGFTAPSKQTTTILADGSRVVNYYYKRNKYAFTLGSCTGVSTSGSTASGSYYYGATLTLKASVSAGYNWSKWSNGNTNKTFTIAMPASALTLTPSVTKVTYTIKYCTAEGTDLATSNPSTYNVETAAITLAEPTALDGIFEGWYSDTSFKTKVTSIPKGSTGNKVFYAKYWAGVVLDLNVPCKYENGTITSLPVDIKPSYPNSGSDIKKVYIFPDSTYEDKVTGKSVTELKPVLQDWTFKGWSTDKNGSGIITDSTVFKTSVKTIYAVWSPVLPKMTWEDAPNAGFLEILPNYDDKSYRTKFDPFDLTKTRKYASDESEDSGSKYAIRLDNARNCIWEYIEGDYKTSIPDGTTLTKKAEGQETLTTLYVTSKASNNLVNSSVFTITNPYRANDGKIIRVTASNNAGSEYVDNKIQVWQLPKIGGIAIK